MVKNSKTKTKKKSKAAAKYVAKRYVAPEGAEVLGQAIVGYFDNLTSYQLDPVIERYGLNAEAFDPQAWYPMQVLFDVVAEANPDNDYTVGVALGKAVGESILRMLDIPDATSFLETYIHVVPSQVHRNLPEGYGFNITKIDEGHYWVMNNTPHSTSGVYGYLWEVMRNLVPSGDFIVQLVNNSDFIADVPATIEVKFSVE